MPHVVSNPKELMGHKTILLYSQTDVEVFLILIYKISDKWIFSPPVK